MEEPTRIDPAARTELGEPDPTRTSQRGTEERRLREDVRAKLFGDDRAETVRIGRFAVEKKIGEGGMGAVFSAHDPELERRVAIKLLSRGAVEGSAGRARLQREARALAKLSHPNVVHVYEVGEHDSQVFVAMEFVRGRTLRDWLRDAARTPSEVVAMYGQAARGLAAAHSEGLVHRDFKPDNVLVGDDGRARVLDFGLARPEGSTEELGGIVDGAVGITTLTETGAVVGTPAYMAPEQFRGEPSDARTDQFALCVALYEALFGKRPFGGATVQELAASVCLGTLREASRPATVPAGLEAVLKRGLQVDPSERFESIDALLAALEAALAPRPKRRGLAWVLAAIGLVALAVAGWFLRPGARDAPPPAPAAQPAPAPPDGARALAELGGQEMVDAAAAKAIRCVETTCRVERRFVTGLAATPKVLETQARPAVIEEGGAVTGLKLYGVRRESLPGRLGLGNGDQLLRIGGRSIGEWGSIAEVLEAMNEASELEVEYVRRGETRRLRIELVD